jgi:glucose-1-phosphate thymidylyltransferase
MEKQLTFMGEYFLTHTISLMIEEGAKVRTEKSDSWLDTGTIDATLDTNKILLETKSNKTQNESVDGVEIIAPSFVHPSAEIKNSVIGPYSSIGANCKIVNSWIEQSIVEADCEIQDAALSRSLVGIKATIRGRGDGQAIQVNIGDNSDIFLA